MQFWTCVVLCFHVVKNGVSAVVTRCKSSIRVIAFRCACAIPPPPCSTRRRKCFKWFFEYCRNLGNRWNSARSNPETLPPGECLKQKREGGGEERGISKRGPTEECQFLIGRYASRPLCRVCDPLREFWIPFHPVVRFIRNRRTIHNDKLVSRLEESLVNSSHRENCFQCCM